MPCGTTASSALAYADELPLLNRADEASVLRLATSIHTGISAGFQSEPHRGPWAKLSSILPHTESVHALACAGRPKRRGRCGSGLRGGNTAYDAVRSRQVARAAGGAIDAPDARFAGQTAYAADQHDPRSTGRNGVDIPRGLERALLIARQIVDGKAPEVPMEAAKIAAALSQ